jgi:hypothetical protein
MSRMTLDRDVEELKRHGVPMRAIVTVVPAPMKIKLDTSGELFWPDDTGLPVWVLPVCAADSDIPDAIEAIDPLTAVRTGPVIDLLAFSPLAPRRWALRRGIATVLGAIEPQRCTPEPIAVHQDITNWLRAECRGIVLLTREPIVAARVLRQCAAIEAEDEAHAAELRRLLAVPPPKWPVIRVRAAHRNAP